MKPSRFTEEQIMAVLREHEAGAKAGDLARKHGVSEATLYNWKAKYGGMDVSDAKRLKALEDENAKLKKLLGDWEASVTVIVDGVAQVLVVVGERRVDAGGGQPAGAHDPDTGPRAATRARAPAGAGTATEVGGGGGGGGVGGVGEATRSPHAGQKLPVRGP